MADLPPCNERDGCQQVIRAGYYDIDSLAYLPLPYAKVMVIATEYGEEYGERYVITDDSFIMHADENGRINFTDPCRSGPWNHVEVKAWPKTPRAYASTNRTLENGMDPEVLIGPAVRHYNKDDSGMCVRESPTLSIPQYAARAVRSATAAAIGAESFFGASAPVAEIELRDGYLDVPTAYYDRYRRHIRINADDVFGGGIGTVAHEFGHHYHDRTIGGLAEVYPYHEGWDGVSVNFSCLFHTLTGPETPSCAFMEAVAHLVAVASIRTDADYLWYYIAEAGISDSLGYQIEGAIASYMWRIATDPADGVAMGGPGLLSALQHCQDRIPSVLGYQTTNWGKINNVASLAYCIEQEQYGYWLPLGVIDVSAGGFTTFPDGGLVNGIGQNYLLDSTGGSSGGGSSGGSGGGGGIGEEVY